MENGMNCGKPKMSEQQDITVIRSQAEHGTTPVVRGSDGSETRATAKAMTAPRASRTQLMGDEIVRTLGNQGLTGKLCEVRYSTVISDTYVDAAIVRRERRARPGRVSGQTRHGVNCWKAKAMVAMPISSQANEVVQARALDGSETRDRAKAVMSPRVPRTQTLGDDIVRYSREIRRAGINGQRNRNGRYYIPRARMFCSATLVAKSTLLAHRKELQG